VLKKSPDSMAAKILREQARMESTEGKERAEATEALENASRARPRTRSGRQALGAAHSQNGNTKEGRPSRPGGRG